MANRSFEIIQRRQVMAQMRLGESGRAIPRFENGTSE